MGDTQGWLEEGWDVRNLGDVVRADHLWHDRLDTQGPYPGEDVGQEHTQWDQIMRDLLQTDDGTPWGTSIVKPNVSGPDILDLTYGVPQEHPAAPGGGAFDYYPEEPQYPDLHMPSDDTFDPSFDEPSEFDVPDF